MRSRLAALPLVLVSGLAFAQVSTLRLAPVAPFLSCDGEFELEVQVDTEVDVHGYQLFLRYPAASVRPIAFEGREIDETLWLAGPDTFAPDFDLVCTAAVDPWQDGLGEDVLAVVATVYDGEFGAGPLAAPGVPLNGVGLVLGRLRFEVLEGASIASLPFSWNEEICEEGFDQATRLFDEFGAEVEASTERSVRVDRIPAGPLSDLACETTTPGVVRLTWALPAGLVIDGVRVRRDGETIADLAAAARSYEDADAPGGAAAIYSVAPIVSGTEGCSASCSVGGAPAVFFRGDADLDRRLAIADPVIILRRLFQGGELFCDDAADASDDGRVAINDAILVFDFLFRSGPELAPPGAPTPSNTVPGPDPTDDSLGCAMGL